MSQWILILEKTLKKSLLEDCCVHLEPITQKYLRTVWIFWNLQVTESSDIMSW